MAVLAGRLCTLYVGGTPTTMTGEACAQVSGNVYQVGDAAKRVIDPATAISLYEDGSASSLLYALDYATGQFTFASPPDEPVTIDAKYIPLLAVAEAKSVDIMVPTPVMADVTRLNDAGKRVLEIAKRCELTVTGFTTPTTDLDSGGGTTLYSSLLASDLVFVKAAISSVQTLSGWFAPEMSWQHNIDEALTGTLRLIGQVQTCTGRSEQALFSMVTL